jgi:methylated-DNA-[protein]-cysteine S-methyltransferase
MNISTIQTKISSFLIEDDGSLITKIEFLDGNKPNDIQSELAKMLLCQIDEYLLSQRIEFSIPFEIIGTPFQKAVLKVISSIPYGKTMSYTKLAEASGYPKAQRAVGSVCRQNLLPIIIPCHRVIKQNGDFGEYNGGQDKKARLLMIERR